MRAAIYCRVSTDNQEREGTSLQTQLENCLAHCRGKGYDVAYRFSEAYSGLSLERPELDKLRELVITEQIDVVVIYCLDRLSRDPTHGVILTQEFEKHGVKLEAVTEDVDNSELGKLISYIRGFASKLEAEKIKERTQRGKRAKAKAGFIPCGFHSTYGYDYVKAIPGERVAHRVINETEAKWVKQMFEWCAYEGLTAGAIRDRLMSSHAPTKNGGPWRKGTILAILKNPAYTGRTYVFTWQRGRARQRPREEWIELPGVTPRLVSDELYDAVQKQLRTNYARASRNNTKRQYLLRSHVRCRRCGRAYTGDIAGRKLADGSYRLIYHCAGKSRDRSAPLPPCRNRVWQAGQLEALVWSELQCRLSQPEVITRELERQRQNADQMGMFETELKQIECQLRAVDRDQYQLLQWAMKGFPENQVEAENKRLNRAREVLKVRKAELEAQLKASQDAVISIPKLESFIADMQGKLPNLDFEGKRLALEMLNITVWIDGESVEITGTIPAEAVKIATMQSQSRSHNLDIPFSFKVEVAA